MFSLMVETKGTHEEYGELFPGRFYKKGKCLHQGYLFFGEVPLWGGIHDMQDEGRWGFSKAISSLIG